MIIRAQVLTNSCDDKCARVKVKVPGFVEETPLIESLGGVPLKKGDWIFMDVSEGYENALIVGRSFDKITKYESSVEGSLLFESSDNSDWTIASVNKDKLKLKNSSNVEILIEGSKVSINANDVVFNGGSNGGLVIASKVQKLIDALKVFAAAATTVAAIPAAILDLDRELNSIGAIENNNVKH